MTTAAALSILLLWSSLGLILFFAVSDHYYAGDARYLTLIFFTLIISGATMLRQRRLPRSWLLSFGAVCALSIVAATPLVVSTAHHQKLAYEQLNHRNLIVNQILSQHHVSVLVGDYWRVLPLKAGSNSQQAILPLANCTQPREVLSSRAWQLDLHHRSFAYLLSLDSSLTDFPHCSLHDVTQAYGHPNASTVIDGTLTNPRELLLFYDSGIAQSPTKRPIRTAASSNLAPMILDRLRSPSCAGQTIMQIVAHQDDDLLFMNPDLLHDIHGGQCIRTIYITAGDAGANKFYWLGREQGSEAAYDYMRQQNGSVWDQRTLKLGNQEFATLATPRGNATQSLLFLHLPDGNVDGRGFGSSHFVSLAKLETGEISSIETVDGQSKYSESSLVNALTALMAYYKPAEIRTQANLVSAMYPDHSDHMAVGRLTKQAYQQYEQQLAVAVVPQLKYYTGYPIHALPPNITGDDLTEKQAAFFQYARFDGGVCHTLADCKEHAVYSIYLERQYQNDY